MMKMMICEMLDIAMPADHKLKFEKYIYFGREIKKIHV